ncbi:carboxypeptidase-like regulatory domain-containing protein [uncultured Maribacter sp.]|mgnify:FL=1|uniref:carboxypeptidase-like regulatory domain-containing protein n=1 Tax=uncultured Maribacter sp. TaxID=431308 RepID=UPI0030DBFEE4|tara:strand:- start:2668 stop:2955 length:288 start_codon:yes stop_codon:yes gene_type:complete
MGNSRLARNDRVFKFLVTFLFSFQLVGQIPLSGTVLDDERKPIQNVSVIAKGLQTESIISYGFTNHRGEFSISIDMPSDVVIEFSFIGFKKKKFF